MGGGGEREEKEGKKQLSSRIPRKIQTLLHEKTQNHSTLYQKEKESKTCPIINLLDKTGNLSYTP